MSTDQSTTQNATQSFAFIHEGDETAIYNYSETHRHWFLLVTEKGDAAAAIATARATGAAMRIHSDLPHLRAGGVWQDPIYSFEAPTAEQRIRTEIANLRAEADRLEENARYSDDRHSNHGSLRMRADAMEHVLDVFAAEQD